MPNHYDRIFKENIDPLLLPLLRKVCGIVPEKLVPIDAKMQVTQEGEMDSIRRVVHRDPTQDYGLQIEFHLPDEDLRRRNLVHYGLFHQITGLPLRQIVIYGGAAPPQRITANRLELTGLEFGFEVVSLNTLDKNLFLHSDIPEEVVLAILCDFGGEAPEKVIFQILNNLQRLLKGSGKIRKYQKQLLILSRLRKIESVTKASIEAMTIHYDIETDGLYLEGLEKGTKKGRVEGREEGREEGVHHFTIKLWLKQQYTIAEIADLVEQSEQKIIDIISEYLRAQGKSEAEIKEALKIV